MKDHLPLIMCLASAASFTALKATGIISLSWWWVLLPFALCGLLVVALFVAVMLAAWHAGYFK